MNTPHEIKNPNAEKVFDDQRQRELEQIVESTFSGYLTKFNCIVIATMGSVIDKTLLKHGFGRASKQLFEKAPNHFVCGYNKKDFECIMLKKYPKDQEFSVQPRSTLAMYSKEDREKVIKIYAGLQKTYNTIDVSSESVRKYIKQNKLLLPSVAPNSDSLFAILCKEYGSVIRTNGENTPEECFLILRKTRPIPQSVINTVKRIVRQYFIGKDIVANTDIGEALKNNGIIFSDFGYTDLTGFLRSFTELFSIVPIKNEKTGGFQINVRILKDGLIGDDPESVTLIGEISELIRTNKCSEVFNPVILRRTLELNSPSAWDMVVRAASNVDGEKDALKISEWEKLVITLDSRLVATIDDAECIRTYGITDEQWYAVKEAVLVMITNAKVIWNFSTIGRRVQEFCKNNRLAQIIYRMGLVAGDDTDRKYCFLYCSLFLAESSHERYCMLWRQYKESSIDNKSMRNIVTHLYSHKNFDAILYAIDNLPSKVSLSEALKIYYSYSDSIMSPGATIDLPPVSPFSPDRAYEILSIYLDSMMHQDRVDCYCNLLSLCILYPEQFISKMQLSSYLSDHRDYLSARQREIVDKAMKKNYIHWVVANYLFDGGFVVDSDGAWSNCYNKCKKEFETKIESSDSESDREATIKEAMKFFPDEKEFSERIFDTISASLKGVSVEYIYEVCSNLISTSNYSLLIQLFESGHLPNNDSQLLSWISRCYHEVGNEMSSAKIKLSEALSYKPNSLEAKACVDQLVELVFSGYEDGSLFNLDSKSAYAMLKKCKDYKCQQSKIATYHLAMIGLAVSANQQAVLALLYSLLPETEKELHKNFCDRVESIIARCDEAYAVKVTSFVKVYEYILTVEAINTIDLCNGATRHLFQNDIAILESQYEALKKNSNKVIDAGLAVKLVMACSDNEMAWKVLSKYSYAAKKTAVNYTVNFILVLRFKNKDVYLDNITGALRSCVDSSLPRNYLENNLYLLNNTIGLETYWLEFRKHIAKYNSFAAANHETIVGFYRAISSKRFLREDERSLLIDILYQTQSFDEFYDNVLAVSSTFENWLLENPQHVIRFLAVIACNRQYHLSDEYLERIDAIRTQNNASVLTRSDKAAMLWIDELLKRRVENSVDETLFSVSGKILADYPKAPPKHLVKTSILPSSIDAPIHHSLISHWVNTFECFENIASAYYKLYRIRASDPDERMRTYRLAYSLVRRLIVLNEGPDSSRIGDYARECKNYYALKALVHDTSAESEEFMQKMRDGISEKYEIDEVNSYAVALDKFRASGLHHTIIEEVIHCGVSDYWDTFIDKVIAHPEEFSNAMAPLAGYLKVIDQRPLRRRLLQIYLYANVANMQYHQAPSYELLQITKPEIQKLEEHFKDGSIDPEVYMTAFRRLATTLYPTISELIAQINNSQNNSGLVDQFNAMHFALANLRLVIRDDWEKLGRVLGNDDIPMLREMFVPCMVFIHTNEEFHKIAGILISAQNPRTIAFLKHPQFRTAIGEFYSDYYTACFYVNCGKYDDAQAAIHGIVDCPDYMRKQVDELSMAIRERKNVDLFLAGKGQKTENMPPQFSFMRSCDPSGSSIEDLLTEFASESNLQDSAAKCKIAQKIYHYLLGGAVMHDVRDFVFRWGFYAIAAENNWESRTRILFEMLDDVGNLKVKLKFRHSFIEQFLRLLNGCSFDMLYKHLPKIKDHYKLLYTHYKPIENHECYAQLILLLAKLHEQANGNDDASRTVQKVEDIQKTILAVKTNFPQNKFAQNAVEFAEQFMQQIKERGLFEVRILNEEKYFNGSVFYQIKNIGTETIPEVSITMYIDGAMDTTIKEVRVTDKLPRGLRPGQTFAGEYLPGISIPEGQDMVCVIQLEYGDRSYVAVDAKSGGKLIVRKDHYAYSKAGDGGYFDGAITKAENFIERQELREIAGGLIKCEQVILHGTNGTGKSSVLNWLKQVQIPTICNQRNMLPISLDMVSNTSCSEAQVINGLLDLICRDDSPLLEEIEELKYEHPEAKVDFDKTVWKLSRAAEKRKKLVLIEENGPNSNRIMELFSMISSALSCSNIALFVLWDDFEQVIASPNVDPHHMRFLKTVSEKVAGNIQFVFSGSNYLLEAISTESGSTPWNEILTRSGTTQVKIGNLYYQPSIENQGTQTSRCEVQFDFVRFLTQKRALNNGEMHYSSEAIEYLWRYTNGHAFYSCLLGNRTLEILSMRHVNRRCIYPSDVYNAIYESEKYMPPNKSDKSKEKAIESQIFQDISDNIAVKCVGHVLGQEIAGGAIRVTCARLHELVYQKRPDITPQDVNRAIEILAARDFILKYSCAGNTGSGLKSDSDDEYAFTSDLYLERFLDISIPELATKELDDIERKKRTADEIVADISQGFMSGSITQEKLDRIRALLGSTTTINTGGGAVAGPGGTVNQQIVHINAQVINTAFNTLLAGDTDTTGLLEALANMPTVSRFLSDSERGQLQELTTDLDFCETEDQKAEKLQDIEALVAPAEQRMLSDTIGAAVAMDSFYDISEERWAELLGIQGDTLEELGRIRSLPAEFATPLSFAVMLHNVFQQIAERTESSSPNMEDKQLDYCPVAIMYCKVVEAMLKKLHTPIYIQRIGNLQVKKGGMRFSDLLASDGVTIKDSKDISIGSFAFNIVSGHKDNDVDHPNSFRVRPKTENINLITGFTNPTAPANRKWSTHAEKLAVVHAIRNKSAHEAAPISKENFDWLIQVLFSDGELLRIAELAD